MTDRVVRVLLQHPRHVGHLEDPHALLAEKPLDLADEGDRVFDVVEHRDRGDGVERLAADAPIELGRRKEVPDDGHSVHRFTRDVGRVDPVAQELVRIRAKQRAVVATDVEHAPVMSSPGSPPRRRSTAGAPSWWRSFPSDTSRRSRGPAAAWNGRAARARTHAHRASDRSARPSTGSGGSAGQATPA